MSRKLTKSRFKVALECPTKLYYSSNKEYGNKKLDDPFLKALAKGGFQVGALAKAYYPQGHDIVTLDKSLALKQSNELMEKDEVVIFEPAIEYNDFFIRVDVLKKNKNSIHLIEVKAKSYDPTEDNQFFDKRALKAGYYKLKSSWMSYLYDIAFQKAVTQLAYPNTNITCSLMLADKSKVATVEGLNQMFLIKKKDGQFDVDISNIGDLGESVLVEVNVDHEVNLILSGEDIGKKTRSDLGVASFSEDMNTWAKLYIENTKAVPEIGSKCKNCEFKVGSEYLDKGLKSGFAECWEVEADDQTITNIWNFRKTDSLVAQGVKLIKGIQEEDISPEPDNRPGISAKERQWLQVEKVQSNDSKPFTDLQGLSDEISSWVYPFNFIDFETAMVALPFNKGRRPYEQMAFQFSHHILHQDGRIEHATEYINQKQGEFPNFDFVRALKAALEKNHGSIFRYSNHENTVLLQIYEQLKASGEPDVNELCSWIETITKKKQGNNIIWEGPRNMIDQWDVVKRYYYHPRTNGSNSIKYVLPAVLFESGFLREKYSKPIYGARNGIKSHNFKDWTWLKLNNEGVPIDPYKQLEPLFNEYENEQLDDVFFDGEEIRDGGAAATGYAMMQFSQMSEIERERITKALLRYCELDTFAMVMITEHWLEVLEDAQKEAV